MTSLDHPVVGTRRGSPRGRVSPTWVCSDPLLTARQSADQLGISLPGFWKGVADGRLPAPVYVLPRAPRWHRCELHAAAERNRLLPAEAKLIRRNSDQTAL